MAGKRTDNKGRILKEGESQRANLTYMYRYTDAFGKRQTIYAPTLQSLREKENKLAQTAALMGSKPTTSHTVGDIVQRYIQLRAGARQSTMDHYEYMKTVVERYPIWRRRLSDITPSEARLWLLELYKDGKAVSTITVVNKFMRQIFGMAIDDMMAYRNPFATPVSKILSEQVNKRNALSAEEQTSLLNFLYSNNRYRLYRDYIVVLIGTGLRVAEFIGLTKKDVDFNKRTISINHQLQCAQDGRIYIEKPKSNSGYRTIPMSDEVYEAMLRISDKASMSKVVHVVDGHSDFLVLDTQGNLNTVNKFDSTLRRIRASHNKNSSVQIVALSPHILRHTFCTNMALLGILPVHLKYLMGHAQYQTTLAVYTHCGAEEAISAMRLATSNTDAAMRDRESELTPMLTPIAR